MRRTIILLLFGALFMHTGYAQSGAQALQLDIEAAKAYAIQHNKSVQSVRLDYQKSNYAVREAVGQGLPQVSAGLDYNTYFNYEAELSFGSGSGIPADQLAQLDQLMAAGSLQEQALWGLNRPMLLPTEPTLIKMDGASTAQLQVSQLLFSGQYWTGIQVAKMARELNQKNVQKTEQDICNTVALSYYVTLITEESLSIIDSNIINLQETLKNTEAMYNAGMAESTDVDQIKMTITTLQNSRKSVERSVEMNYNMLRMQLGLEAGTSLQLSSTLEGIMESADFDQLITKEFNVQNNIDYQLLEGQEALNEKMLDMEKWSYAPVLSGFYSYNQKLVTTEFDMNPNNVAGITLSVPIYAGGTKTAKVNQAKLELEKTALTKSLVEDQLMIQEQQLRFNLVNAWENYQNQKSNVELAKRIYANIDRKFRQGIASSLDLTQANNNYLQAQNTHLNAIMELLQAGQQLENLTVNAN